MKKWLLITLGILMLLLAVFVLLVDGPYYCTDDGQIWDSGMSWFEGPCDKSGPEKLLDLIQGE